MPRPATLTPLLTLLLLALLAAPAAAQHDEEEDLPSPAPMYDFSDLTIEGNLGVTPGGAQDISFFRDRAEAGEIPHPDAFTAEGLFSEHDLPLATPPCRELICVHGEATEAHLLVQPEVRYIAQLGFASDLKPESFKRESLHLVAVVDKSGSMAGQPLTLVKQSLRLLVQHHLHPGDQLSIVLYGDRSHVHLPPTGLDKKGVLLTAIDAIESAGSTNMEEGLKVGFELARQSKTAFRGATRVMLFTDERPNVGRTDAASFMGMARAASREGVGMTTIGVGVQFGADLATQISSVRGGNLFFFPDAKKMSDVFFEDFDTMVTELAFDMRLEIAPAPGLRVAGVYGIPGDVLKWGEGGSLSVEIATLFLSKRRGAIYIAYAPDGNAALPPARITIGDPVGHVRLGYLRRDGIRRELAVQLQRVPTDDVSPGLERGWMLINEATALKEAARLHLVENKQEEAWQVAHALAGIFRQSRDPALARERALIEKIEGVLAKRAGRQGETPERPSIDPVSGLPRR